MRLLAIVVSFKVDLSSAERARNFERNVWQKQWPKSEYGHSQERGILEPEVKEKGLLAVSGSKDNGRRKGK